MGWCYPDHLKSFFFLCSFLFSFFLLIFDNGKNITTTITPFECSNNGQRTMKGNRLKFAPSEFIWIGHISENEIWYFVVCSFSANSFPFNCFGVFFSHNKAILERITYALTFLTIEYNIAPGHSEIIYTIHESINVKHIVHMLILFPSLFTLCVIWIIFFSMRVLSVLLYPYMYIIRLHFYRNIPG